MFNLLVLDIPEGYRPSQTFAKCVSLMGDVYVEPNGKVTLKYVHSDKIIPSTSWLYINETYMIS